MDWPLIAGAATLGLLGTPHCAAMCSAPCAAAAAGGPGATWAFQAARAAGYAAGGAVAAGSVALLAAWGQWAPALRPAWVLVQAAVLAVGLWMLWRARQPQWRPATSSAVVAWQPSSVPRAAARTGAAPLWRAAGAGGLWWAWPCGLLHSALLLAALGSHPLDGAAVMAAFALASSPGLWLAPWAWRRWLKGRDARQLEGWAARLAGLMLVASAGWALGQGVWHDVAAYCSTRL